MSRASVSGDEDVGAGAGTAAAVDGDCCWVVDEDEEEEGLAFADEIGPFIMIVVVGFGRLGGGWREGNG